MRDLPNLGRKLRMRSVDGQCMTGINFDFQTGMFEPCGKRGRIAENVNF